MFAPLKKLIAAVMVVTLAFPYGAFAAYYDVVRDTQNNIVKNSFNNCVRTQWEVPSDPCAPKMAAPVPMPVPQPAPVAAPVSRKVESLTRSEKTVNFDFDRAALRPDSVKTLDNMIDVVNKSDKVVKARVAGYADRIGNEDYNVELSKKRAQAVANYLQDKGGIDSKVVEMEALGERDPVSNCPKGRGKDALLNCLEQDRRVEIELDIQKSIIRE